MGDHRGQVHRLREGSAHPRRRHPDPRCSTVWSRRDPGRGHAPEPGLPTSRPLEPVLPGQRDRPRGRPPPGDPRRDQRADRDARRPNPRGRGWTALHGSLRLPVHDAVLARAAAAPRLDAVSDRSPGRRPAGAGLRDHRPNPGRLPVEASGGSSAAGRDHRRRSSRARSRICTFDVGSAHRVPGLRDGFPADPDLARLSPLRQRPRAVQLPRRSRRRSPPSRVVGERFRRSPRGACPRPDRRDQGVPHHRRLSRDVRARLHSRSGGGAPPSRGRTPRYRQPPVGSPARRA